MMTQATETKGYNGWTNYETWAVNLWLTNDQTTDAQSREQASDAWNGATGTAVWTRSEHARYYLADQLKDEFEEQSQEVLGDYQVSVWADLLGAALGEVDWAEIADSLLSDTEGYEARA